VAALQSYDAQQPPRPDAKSKDRAGNRKQINLTVTIKATAWAAAQFAPSAAHNYAGRRPARATGGTAGKPKAAGKTAGSRALGLGRRYVGRYSHRDRFELKRPMTKSAVRDAPTPRMA
jgi:hypothetical protein